MTKTISFLFLFLFLTSCGKSGGGSGDHTAVLSDADLQGETAPVAAQTFEVRADMQGFSVEQEDKLMRAIDLIKRVIATDEFKSRVLNYRWNGKKQFNENNGQSNSQIYRSILEGSEELSPGNNNSMDIQIRPYFENSIVIGYTMPSTGFINLNTRFLDSSSFQVNEVAMNLTHEWLHKLGYKHSVNNNSSRPHTVPYAIGYIMRSIAARL